MICSMSTARNLGEKKINVNTAFEKYVKEYLKVVAQVQSSGVRRS
jgi:hypothetical protein